MQRLGDVCEDICRELRRGGGLSHRMPTRYRKGYPLWFQVQVFAKSAGRCFYCGGGADVMDHVVPVSSGGRDEFGNLVPSCWRCNCGKGGRSLEQYRETRARADPDIPNFTEKELRWLARQEIVLPPIPVYRFWFEKQGLRIDGGEAGPAYPSAQVCASGDHPLTATRGSVENGGGPDGRANVRRGLTTTQASGGPDHGYQTP